MKKIIAGILLIAAGNLSGYAQCDKKVLLTGSKTEHLNADSTVQRSEDEETTIEYDKNSITIAPGHEDHKMTGAITSSECNWKTPFKEGKTVLKIAIVGDENKKMNVTITIIGKGGKISFLAEIDDDPGHKIRLVVDKFEEKN